MDAYDFDLYEKNKPQRRAPRKPPAEARPIGHCKTKVKKGKFNIPLRSIIVL
jgi:hypothetical protein